VGNLWNFFGLTKINAVRDRTGGWSFWLNDSFGAGKENLQWSLCHPVLLTIIALRAKLYSQMRISAVNAKGEEVPIPELELIANPNYFQSQQDFLFQQMWFLSACGNSHVYAFKNGIDSQPKALFNLIPSQVDWGKTGKVSTFIAAQDSFKAFQEQTIKYRLDQTDHQLKIADIIPMYDLASGLTPNSFMQSPSRVDGIKQVLINIEENLKAKNVNLKMAARYLAKNKTGIDGAPLLTDADRKEINEKFGSKFLSITNMDVEVQHLVKDLKNLTLDPMFESDAIKCMLAFDFNRDVLNYSPQGSKFDNAEGGLVNVVQNSIQQSADNAMASLTSGLKIKSAKLKASFNHLPIMQATLKSKMDVFSTMQDAIKTGLLNKTITEQDAKVMSDKLKKELGL
jgi:hypothetical protein